MKKLSPSGMKYLKIAHLLFASAWITGGVALTVLNLLMRSSAYRDGVLGFTAGIHYVDTYIVVIAGALGCFTTGLIYAIFTNWGFIKHRWIVVKWCITVSLITFGTVALGPWEKEMLSMAQASGAGVYNDPSFLEISARFLYGGLISFGMLLFAFCISVLKPWKKAK